jgi:hypothetical protein
MNFNGYSYLTFIILLLAFGDIPPSLTPSLSPPLPSFLGHCSYFLVINDFLEAFVPFNKKIY